MNGLLWENIDTNIFGKISRFLPIEDLLSLHRVCKTWKQKLEAKQIDWVLWGGKCFDHFKQFYFSQCTETQLDCLMRDFKDHCVWYDYHYHAMYTSVPQKLSWRGVYDSIFRNGLFTVRCVR